MTKDTKNPLIYITAGEPSGDVLGARLMAALKARENGNIRFAGIGGDLMAEEGLVSLFPMKELSIMGLLEILPHARRLLRRIKQAAKNVDDLKPDMVLTIDSPGFAHRFAVAIKSKNITRVHYVAPSVWAWKPKRVFKFKKHFDHLLALLPFEPPYFEKVGLPCHFVGHSIIESGADKGDGVKFRKDNNIAEDNTVLCVLPGSRSGEVGRLLPVFQQTVEKLTNQSEKPFHVVIPTVSSMADTIKKHTQNWRATVHIVEGTSVKYDAMAASNAALAASGTVALELAMAKVPTVVAYKFSTLTHFILLRLVGDQFAHLLNIILDNEIIPERIQDDCNVENLSSDISSLLGQKGRDQISQLKPALAQLQTPDHELPSFSAADVVLKILKDNENDS